MPWSTHGYLFAGYTHLIVYITFHLWVKAIKLAIVNGFIIMYLLAKHCAD